MHEVYPIVPGRGLNSQTAKDLRLEYIKQHEFGLHEIPKDQLISEDIRNNIESSIGSIEIPVGLVGPLLFNDGEHQEYVHGVVGTLEGALVASMNRGAKCLSLCGGFSAHVIHQKMIRTPMFIFEDLNQSIQFKKWVSLNFSRIKKVAESHSNHACLEYIIPYVIGKSVHLKFVYTTGDASGQNMTTACTWHSTLWIQDQFTNDTAIEIIHFIVEGNGASDKKVSHFSINHGRGIHVVADVHLEEDIIKKVLRTTSDDIVRCFNQSIAMSKIDGMVGYNINVANAIAGIFAATGQDLACIHESSTAVLNVEKTPKGLYLSLNLPSLVIGTIGGGTHLKKQREALELMHCYGNGKVNRFAKLIVGFALSLEISTYAAIVSGQFAKAHEKLGRNKPNNWLVRSEITKDFIQNITPNLDIVDISRNQTLEVDNGIITNLTSRVSKKLIGFVPMQVQCSDGIKNILLKSKPLDEEVIKGLHFMASNIDTELADLIYEFRQDSEYKNCHLKEIEMFAKIDALNLRCTPKYFGQMIDPKREVYLFLQEILDQEQLLIINSENEPEVWTKVYINKVIEVISNFHLKIVHQQESLQNFEVFDPSKSIALYRKMINLMLQDAEDNERRSLTLTLESFIDDLANAPDLPKTIIHNDFNSRNIAIMKDGHPLIYDWELAVVNYPHRDIVEFLCFVLQDQFKFDDAHAYLKHHFDQNKENGISWKSWRTGYTYAIKEFLITRISFYIVGGILIKYDFADRVFKNGFRLLDMLNSKEHA